MKQIDYVNAYLVTNDLITKPLSIQSKWLLFNLRKDLSSHYEFYSEESKKLLNSYKIKVEENLIRFETPKLADQYKEKQEEIDQLEIEEPIEKKQCKLSDVPDITVEQMEKLQNFIEFIPE